MSTYTEYYAEFGTSHLDDDNVSVDLAGGSHFSLLLGHNYPLSRT